MAFGPYCLWQMGPVVFAPFSGYCPPAELTLCHHWLRPSGDCWWSSESVAQLLHSYVAQPSNVTHNFYFFPGHRLSTHRAQLREWNIGLPRWNRTYRQSSQKLFIKRRRYTLHRKDCFMYRKSDVLLSSVLWTFLGRFTCCLYWFFTLTDANSDFRSALSKCLPNRDTNEFRCFILKICKSGEVNSTPKSEQHPFSF